MGEIEYQSLECLENDVEAIAYILDDPCEYYSKICPNFLLEHIPKALIYLTQPCPLSGEFGTMDLNSLDRSPAFLTANRLVAWACSLLDGKSRFMPKLPVGARFGAERWCFGSAVFPHCPYHGLERLLDQRAG